MERPDPDLRLGRGQGSVGHCPHRHLPGEHRGRRAPRTPAPVLSAGWDPLPREQGAPRGDRLRRAEPHRRSAVLQARPDHLPEPAHLLERGRPETHHLTAPLRTGRRRIPLPRQRGIDRIRGGSLRHHVEALEDLSAYRGHPLRDAQPAHGRAQADPRVVSRSSGAIKSQSAAHPGPAAAARALCPGRRGDQPPARDPAVRGANRSLPDSAGRRADG